MSLRLALGSLLSLASVVGCAARPATFTTVALRGTTSPLTITPAKAKTFVVWGNEGETQTTHLVSVRSGVVTELGQASGAIIVWNDHAYRFEAEEKTAPLYDCDTQKALPGSSAALHRPTLVELGTGTRIALQAFGDTSGMNELNDSVEVASSLGPFVFISLGEWGYSCGAHGSSFRSSIVWDLRDQKLGEILTEDERARIAGSERVDAGALLNAEDPVAGDTGGVDEVELVEEMPSYKNGRVSVDLHFATWACYACSDGRWSSYSRSAFVEAHETPASLASFAKPYPWLGAYIRKHPDSSIGGVSEIEDPKKIAGLAQAFAKE